MFNWFKKKEAEPIIDDYINRKHVVAAIDILTAAVNKRKVTKAELTTAIGLAIEHLDIALTVDEDLEPDEAVLE